MYNIIYFECLLNFGGHMDVQEDDIFVCLWELPVNPVLRYRETATSTWSSGIYIIEMGERAFTETSVDQGRIFGF